MQILITLSLALLAGLMLSRVAKLLGLPAVTAYLVAGILIGPFLLGAVELPEVGFLGFNAETETALDIDISSYSLISDVALGFIAFSIGNEFRISQLKKIGRQATVIGIWQAVATTLIVDGALIGLHFILGEEVLPLSAAIVLGAIASATAPAATLMVVKQYKAKGALTDILLPVVALDDAVGLVLFAVSFGISRSLSAGSVEIAEIVLGPIFEVFFSILLGFVMGMLFTYAERFFHSNSKRLAMSICFVLFTVALSKIEFSLFGIHVAFSPLLSCMMLGTVFCNACDFSEELMGRADRWATPILILFFVLSGAELDLLVFTKWQIVLIGVVYIAFRSVGKYLGAYSSAKLTKCDDNIVKYLGITLLPQAGVALGMAIKAKEVLPEDIGALIASITLFAVLIYELVGPMLTKMSLISSGDIVRDGATSARRRDGIHFRRPHDVHHSETHK